MLRKSIALIICVLLLLLPATGTSAEAEPNLTYEMIIDENGTGIIRANFTDRSLANLRNFWILVPKNLSLADSSLSGKLLTYSMRGGEYVFYDNLTIWYESPFSIKFHWNMSYAALIIEPDAIFFSPAIGFSQFLSPTFIIHLPKTTSEVIEAQPKEIESSEMTYVFRPKSGTRIGIAFRVRSKAEMITLNSSIFSLEFPKRYESIGKRTLEFYERIRPIMNDMFNVNLSNVKVRLFLPKKLSELNIGGFVPITTAYRLGTIYLNPFWIRTKEGYFESIAAHELIHHYLFTAGISTDLLWFHEGMANYVGIAISKIAGLGAMPSEEELLYIGRNIKTNDLSFVFRWRPDNYVPGHNVSEHYGAAYYIVWNMSHTFGDPSDDLILGQSFFSSLFKYITESNLKIKNNDGLSSAIVAATNFSPAAYRTLMAFGLKVNLFIRGYESIRKTSSSSIVARLISQFIGSSVSSAYNATIFVDPAKADAILSEASKLVEGFEISMIFFLFLLMIGLLARELEKFL